jgi:hypothetical protein
MQASKVIFSLKKLNFYFKSYFLDKNMTFQSKHKEDLNEKSENITLNRPE